MSRHLALAGRDHVVLEARRTLGGGWQDRWEEFCLVTPNWSSSLPGFPYDGNDPDGFMPRSEIAARVARYASVIDASTPEEIDRILDGIPDPAGQFYRFSLAGSLLRGSKSAWQSDGE